MKLLSTLAAVAATFVGTMGQAFALPNPVPEPGTLPLIALAAAGVVYLAKRRK